MAPQEEPLAVGVIGGLLEAGELWAEAGGSVEIACWAGVRGPAKLQDGLRRVVEMGAEAVVIWGRGWESEAALPEGLAMLDELGLHTRVICPSSNSPHCDFAFFQEAFLAKLDQPPSWIVDEPTAPLLLSTGSVGCVISPPLEEWGRAAMTGLLGELEPGRARILPKQKLPDGLSFTRETLGELEERWRQRLSRSHTIYSFSRDASVSASE